ncbi:MAG: DUF4337 domain-containing protein [Candidatus Solibacter usitatus]|nr:DUF4337 domain-containing protein [Candidatus Solibacter usitatus]
MRTLIAASPAMPAGTRETLEKRAAKHEVDSKRYAKEKDEIKRLAESYEKQYEQLNIHDDQFDMSEACFTVAIALCGVTALTRRAWLFRFAIVLASIGFALELNGFLGWLFHPEWLAKLLG